MNYITEQFGYSSNSRGFTLHRRKTPEVANCSRSIQLIYNKHQTDWWVLGTTFKNICLKCLATYSKKEITKIKYEFIVQKLKS